MFVVVLAAGSSSRFGSPKQLALIEGVPMLERVVRRTFAVARPDAVLVVVSKRHPELQAMLATLGVRRIVNPHPVEGIGTSIRAGVASLPQDAAAAMIVLADQAWVTQDDYVALTRCWRRHPGCRVAAAYAGTCGAPAIFPRTDFAALATLHGDSGARQLLLSDPRNVRLVPVPNATRDVDSPDDLAAPPAERTL
jgi:molybdenum cofactor cytidylyltransferase